MRERGCVAADRDRGVNLFKVEIITRFEPFKASRRDIGDEGSALRNDHCTTSTAALREIECTGNMRKGRRLKCCAICEFKFACAFHTTILREREQFDEGSIRSRRTCARHAGARGAHGWLESSQKLPGIDAHRSWGSKMRARSAQLPSESAISR